MECDVAVVGGVSAAVVLLAAVVFSTIVFSELGLVDEEDVVGVEEELELELAVPGVFPAASAAARSASFFFFMAKRR